MFEQEDVQALLTTAYENEVVSRGMAFAADDDTTSKLLSVSKWLTSVDVRPCLLLYGGVGNGKSSMAKAVRDLFVGLRKAYADDPDYWKRTEDEKRFIHHVRDKLPAPVFISATEIVRLAASEKERYESVKNCLFLIVDDMGIEPNVVKNFGTEVTPLTDIIYSRYERMAMTIITSNLDDESITGRYGERVSDRLNEIFERLSYDNRSYR